jgi:hypothetical protein
LVGVINKPFSGKSWGEIILTLQEKIGNENGRTTLIPSGAGLNNHQDFVVKS